MKNNYYTSPSNQLIYSMFYSSKKKKNDRFRNHRHTEIELGFILEGEGIYNLAGKTYTVSKGDLFIVRSNEQHCIPTIISDSLVSFNIHLTSYFLWNICSDYIPTAKIQALIDSGIDIKSKHTDSKIATVFSKIINLYDKENENSLCDIKFEVINLVKAISQKIEVNSEQSIPSANCFKEIQNAISFIKRNYSKQIGLDDIAKSAAISRSHLSNSFKSVTGMSPYNFLITTRIEKAVELLKNTDEKIMNVSLECGFTSLTSFNKSFKNSVGITPIELRNIYKK